MSICSDNAGSDSKDTICQLDTEDKASKEKNSQKMINSYFSLDQPIQSPEQDCLDRLPFAKALSVCINHWNSKENFTMALCGPWGIGKTSVKNLVVDFLGEEKKYDIVEFNPSELHNNNAITLEFFKTLLESLNQQLHAGLTNRLSKYAARTSGALKGIDSTYTKLIGSILGFVSSPFRPTDKSMYAVKQETAEQSLGVLKAEIFKELDSLKKPIIFIIDDIDRLNKEQMQLLFSLLKSNADFPKIMYLLLFDYNVATRVLQEIDPAHNGDEYLKKFIQVFLDVPPIDPNFLQQQFFHALNRITTHLDLKISEEEQTQLQQLQPYFLPFFQSMRDIKRYFNSLRFHLNLIKNLHYAEVKLNERCVLEVIRIFENKVYRSLLTDVTFKPTRMGGPLIISHQIHIALEYATEARRPHVKKLLDFLSPLNKEELIEAEPKS